MNSNSMQRLVAFILICSVLGCTRSTTPSGSAQTDKPPVLKVAPVFSLTDQSGKSYGADELLGRAWVVNFFSTRCEETSPGQTALLVKLQEELQSGSSWNDIRFVSITVDPDHDTPEVLHDYAVQADADTQHWKFLTGDAERIQELANVEFELPSTKSSDGNVPPVTANSKFALIDPQGHIRGFYDSGNETEIQQLRQDLDRTLQERILFIPDLLDTDWMETRSKVQAEALKTAEIFHDFSFTDQVRESGILFRSRIVDDAGREHKPCHYDHGNGLAIADVDGDDLPDVYFVTQVGENQLWRNKGDGTFEDITSSAGVAVRDSIGVAASFADIDNDGDPDLYVTNVRSPNVLLENDGHGKFSDISKAAGVDYSGHSSASVFFDYNRDGLLDLYVVNVGQYTTESSATVVDDRFTGNDDRSYTYKVAHLDAFAGHLKPERSESSRLFENQGGNRFADVTEKVGLKDSMWSGDASPLDFNEDGWQDLYVLNMQGHDEYYENVNGERFVKKGREVFPATPWGAMGVKVFDFDNDGRMDIYVTDMHTDMGEAVDPSDPRDEKRKTPKEQFAPGIMNTDENHVWGNAFFHKQADGTMKEVSDRIGVETYWPWGLSVGDLNADGFEDIFVAGSMNYPFRYSVNSLLLNNRGTEFIDSEFPLGIEPRRGGRTAVPWYEIDLADPENSVAKAFQFKGVEATRAVAWGALGTRSSVIFDMDNDGDQDILTNDFKTEPIVLLSNLTDQVKDIRYLKIRLVGRKSNRDGLGAVVKVHTTANTYTKVYDGQSGYLSQSSYPLYFGLGQSSSVDRIEVLWPSGATQDVENSVELNSLIVITEPE